MNWFGVERNKAAKNRSMGAIFVDNTSDSYVAARWRCMGFKIGVAALRVAALRVAAAPPINVPCLLLNLLLLLFAVVVKDMLTTTILNGISDPLSAQHGYFVPRLTVGSDRRK